MQRELLNIPSWQLLFCFYKPVMTQRCVINLNFNNTQLILGMTVWGKYIDHIQKINVFPAWTCHEPHFVTRWHLWAVWTTKLCPTCFCSSPRPSHIDATILDTSPKVALGFWPLIAAWVSLKNRAYADTGFWGSLGSFFFFFFGVLGFFVGSIGAGRFSPMTCNDSNHLDHNKSHSHPLHTSQLMHLAIWILTSLTLLLSSCSSSLMELEGDGVADLLAGGDGEVWVILGPAIFRLSCPLSWDWLMVVSWFRDIMPLGLFMVMIDFITMAGLGGYWRRWAGPRLCEGIDTKKTVTKAGIGLTVM